MQRIYFDNAATTQVLPEVIEGMLPYYGTHYGNPSSLHQEGQEAHLGINTARMTMAKLLGARTEDIIFTSGATESTTMVLRGMAKALKHKGNHIITTQIEHSATRATCKALEEEGYHVTYLAPNEEGIITPQSVAEAIRPDTIMASIIFVQNEIGTLQPIEAIGELLASHHIFFHTDAVQAFPFFPIHVDKAYLHAVSLSAHKFHGPKGTGILFLRDTIALPPLLHGGGQEFGLRSGTQNVPHIVGMGIAAAHCSEHREAHHAHCRILKEYTWGEIIKRLPQAQINGSLQQSAPHMLNVTFPHCDSEALLIRLDLDGIAVSAGSACSSEKRTPSHVLTALGKTPEEAQSSIRISFAHTNTKEEVDYFLEKLVYHVSTMSYHHSA